MENETQERLDRQFDELLELIETRQFPVLRQKLTELLGYRLQICPGLLQLMRVKVQIFYAP